VTASHRFTEHTSEVQLEIEAPKLEEVFSEAARALGELITGEVPEPDGAVEDVRVQARDPEALLVEWINELIFRTEQRGKVFVPAAFERADEHEVAATLHGAEIDHVKTAVKAATFHRVRLERDGPMFRARVILDV
jgi:SHS2 domain-containing protein